MHINKKINRELEMKLADLIESVGPLHCTIQLLQIEENINWSKETKIHLSFYGCGNKQVINVIIFK